MTRPTKEGMAWLCGVPREEQARHLVFLDQLARHFDGLVDLEVVVARNDLHLDPAHAAGLVGEVHIEAGAPRSTSSIEGRVGALRWPGHAELDLRLARAGKSDQHGGSGRPGGQIHSMRSRSASLYRLSARPLLTCGGNSTMSPAGFLTIP